MAQGLQPSSSALMLKAAGLYTNPNLFSEVPPGALKLAKNAVISRESIVQRRRGFKQFGTQFQDSPLYEPYQFFFFKSGKLVWTGPIEDDDTLNKLQYDIDGNGTWTDLTAGDILLGSPPYPTETWWADTFHVTEARKNFYISSNSGIKKLCNVAGPLLQAGGVAALDGEGQTSGAAGWMSTDSAVAYRITWLNTDANDLSVEGAPSERIVVTNTSGGNRNVDITFTVPKVITTTNYKYRIYRSFMTATAAIVPSDNVQLTYEDTITSLNISDGVITITDTTPESLLRTSLYTNPNQQTIAYANTPPPMCQDLCTFLGFTIYGNITSKQSFDLTLLAVGSPAGVQINDTLVFHFSDLTTLTLTGKATESINAGQFLVDTGGTPAENIDSTARSIVRVINRIASGNGKINAFYLGSETTPGQILLQEIYVSNNVFSITSSRDTCWSPTIPTTDGPESSNKHVQNGILVSKQNEPESVPGIQQFTVGSENFPIYRTIPLRNAVIILKADGVFKITMGESFPNVVQSIDLTTNLSTTESAIALNNTIYALSNKGIVTITEYEAQIISRPIQNLLDVISVTRFPNFFLSTFGTRSESDHKYMLLYNDPLVAPQDADALTPNSAFVYDIITKAWTIWEFPVQVWDMASNPTDDKFYLGSADEEQRFTFQERKDYTALDYADQEYSISISAVTDYTLTVDDTTNMAVDDAIIQINTDTLPSSIIRKAYITEIVDGTTVLVDTILNWDTTIDQNTAVYKGIPIDFKFVPQYAGSPTSIKHWQEFTILFQQADFANLILYFTSSFISYSIERTINPKDTGEWGNFPWGNLPWGGGVFDLQPVRNHFPREVARAHWVDVGIKNSRACTEFSFVGIGMLYTIVSTRFRGS